MINVQLLFDDIKTGLTFADYELLKMESARQGTSFKIFVARILKKKSNDLKKREKQAQRRG